MSEKESYIPTDAAPELQAIKSIDLSRLMQAEAEQVEERQQDRNKDGQLLVEPGGPTSNLPESQWRLVRTGKFREWFGDWQNAPVIQFKTAHGSIYKYDGEGKTTRFKTATQELNDRQDLTVFVNLSPQEEQDFLAAYRRDGSGPKTKVYVLERQPDNSPKIVRDRSEVQRADNLFLAILANNQWTTFVPASLRPAIGLHPFDTRHFIDGDQELTERHLGNSIVEIEDDKTNTSKITDKNGEPLWLDNGDGTSSFVRITKPYETSLEDLERLKRENNLLAEPNWLSKILSQLKAQGYDGMTMNGKPFVSPAGEKSCDSSSILKLS